MKRIKKVLSIIIVFCCVVNCSVVASSSYVSLLYEDNSTEILDSGKCGENLTWALYSDGLLRISGTGRAYDYCKGILIGRTREQIEAQVKDGTIPVDYAFQEGKIYDDEHGQYVSPWYKYRSEVDFSGYTSETAYNKENPNGWKYNKILIDEGITYIGDWMFYRVSGPTELVVPEGVTKIGRWGIRYSPTLESVVLPDSLTEIEYRGLSRNEVMTNITFGDNLTIIGDNGLAQNHSIEKIELPDSVTTIGTNIFEGNTALITASLGRSTSVPSRTFVSLSNVKNVIIPEETTAIGEYAFYNCTSLESIKIPVNVESINDNAFYLCENLHDVYIDSQAVADLITDKTSCGYLISYARCVYLKENISSTFFESGWKYIETVDGYKRYDSYSNIKSDDIIKSGYAGASVFYIIKKTDVANEYSLTIDGSGALSSMSYTTAPWYEYKENIVSVSVGSDVSNIPINCFYGYTNLKSAVVSCNTIPNNMFYNCGSLASVTLDGVVTIGNYAFYGATLTKIVVPDGVTTIGNNSFGSISTASSVTIGKDVTNISSNAFAAHKGNIIIPENNLLISIGSNAFAKSQGTGILNLPYIVTIGDKAFQLGNSFTNINIGPYIENIGKQTFEYNQNATVTIDKPEVTITIGQNAFRMTPAEKLLFNANITGTENTKIDYENFLIFTSICECDDFEDMFVISDGIVISPIASCVDGNTELYGTGTEVSVFAGDEFKGKYKVIVTGDLNGDSVCDVLDALYAERVCTGKVTAATEQAYAANGCVSDTLDVLSYQNVINVALAS